MKYLLKMICLAAPLFLAGCSNAEKEEEEFNYEGMVKNEQESEWTTGQEEGKHIAGDLIPEPQEKEVEGHSEFIR